MLGCRILGEVAMGERYITYLRAGSRSKRTRPTQFAVAMKIPLIFWGETDSKWTDKLIRVSGKSCPNPHQNSLALPFNVAMNPKSTTWGDGDITMWN